MNSLSKKSTYITIGSAPGDTHDVIGKPQSTNMAPKSKNLKISSRYFENNINWETKFAELSSQFVKSD